MNYDEYMKSPEWRDLRDQCKKNAKDKCEFCGSKAYTAHHVEYPKDFAEDEIGNLVAICKKCHRLAHGIRGVEIDSLSISDLRTLFNEWPPSCIEEGLLDGSNFYASDEFEPLGVVRWSNPPIKKWSSALKEATAMATSLLKTKKHEKIEAEAVIMFMRVKNG